MLTSPRSFSPPPRSPASSPSSSAREWASFTAWCSSKRRATLPATLAAYLSAFEVGSTPRDSADVRPVRRGIRRELGTAPREAAPLLAPELRRAIATLPATTHGARDRALLLIGCAGAFRRSALVALDVADLAFFSAEEGIAVTLRGPRGLKAGRRSAGRAEEH